VVTSLVHKHERAAAYPPRMAARSGAHQGPGCTIRGMAYDVTVILDDRPGELARLGEVAGAAGVNIDGFAAFTGEGKGVVHVLVADEALETLRKAFSTAGIGVADEREVFVVNVANEPGALGETARRLADANVNIDLAYTTFGGVRLVFCTDDMRLAREALDT
jgi:hypothetical protein